ncbi:MAG: hypothetical protein FRX48_09622 [Lasallia pustulata]|uniref:Uncharacterized protein n=1 Tax=Lasallia pustulata TaxID=136370 RepID=A0A5M8PBB6_9LECA|nr:MAG: hypothetical protein FRX48_09622 [Lasallia pustulata]
MCGEHLTPLELYVRLVQVCLLAGPAVGDLTQISHAVQETLLQSLRSFSDMCGRDHMLRSASQVFGRSKGGLAYGDAQTDFQSSPTIPPRCCWLALLKALTRRFGTAPAKYMGEDFEFLIGCLISYS